VLMVSRLDRLARSTRDLLNILDAIGQAVAGFRSLKDARADTTTAHGRLMLAIIGDLAEFERELIRARTGRGQEARKGPRRAILAVRPSSTGINGRKCSSGSPLAKRRPI